MGTQFFQRPEIRQYLEKFRSRIENELATGSQDKLYDEKLRNLGVLLNNLFAHPTKFDENCQANIQWIGSDLESRLQRHKEEGLSAEYVDDLYSTFYRFAVELDLSVPGDLSFELRKFVQFADLNRDSFDDASRGQLSFATNAMSIGIVKKILGTESITNIRNLPKFAADVEKRIVDWETSLDKHRKNAEDLENSLKSYEQGFNFVGLFEGFDLLAKSKVIELARLNTQLSYFGAATMLPMVIELCLLILNRDRIADVQLLLLGAAVPVLSLTALLVYFFRVVLRRAAAVELQLVQIELRKTLCRFIQSYAVYAKSMKDSSPDSLSKFENIIFSGIVSTDEKLPATFDGIEKLVEMFKAIKA